MKTWYIDFSGYCEIEANSEEEAEEKFWNYYIAHDLPLPCNLYEIVGIEEKEN